MPPPHTHQVMLSVWTSCDGSMCPCYCSGEVGTPFGTLLGAGPTRQQLPSTVMWQMVSLNLALYQSDVYLCLHATALFSYHYTELPYNDYFEYFGPDFKLHISPTNMSNQNNLDYLNKIKARLFENLRLVPHAPSVQMQRKHCSMHSVYCTCMCTEFYMHCVVVNVTPCIH